MTQQTIYDVLVGFVFLPLGAALIIGAVALAVSVAKDVWQDRNRRS